MGGSPDKLQRWLDLIAYLAGRRLPVTVDELMENLPAYADRWAGGDERARSSVRRTFERDKDELREFGIPIETVAHGPYAEPGYRLQRRDFYLPYLKLIGEAEPASERPRQRGAGTFALAPREAGAALQALRRVAELPAFPLRREAASAFRKLAFDLDPERFREAPVLYADDTAGEEEEEKRRQTLRTLTEALLARKRVTFTYHGMVRDQTTEREVAPYGLVFHGGHWYLVGRDRLREDVRVFRVGRMREPRPNTGAPRTPDYEVPEEFELGEHVGGEAWELGDEDEGSVEARVRFPFPGSLWAERNRLGRLEAREEGGAQVRRFEVRQADPFLRWLLSLPGEVELLGPPELREALRERARTVLALYEARG